MTILAKDLDYTEIDQESLEKRVFRLIDSGFPEWSERARLNFGNLLVGAFAMVGDILGFYLDNQAGESRWSTARLRKNLLALAKLVDYAPASARAATVDVVLTLAAASSGTVTIAAGRRVVTDEITNAVAYQFLAPVVFAPGETTKTVSVENSMSWVEQFTSTGLANQVFALSRPGVIDDSVSVNAANGAYSEVPDFLDSTPTSKHFTVSVDANDRGAVRTSDGIQGVIPSGTVTVGYKTGGGAAGRVEANKLKRIDGTVYDSLGAIVQIAVTNPNASSGGTDRESNAEMRRNVPRAQRVQGRAVAREDYEIVAEQTPGVARALHLTGNESAAIGENSGQLFIVPTGGGAPSTALLADVAARFDPETGDFPKTNTYQLLVAGAPYLAVNITAIVYLGAGVSEQTARANILASAGAFFALDTTNDQGEVVANDRVNFGYYFRANDGSPANQLAWSDIFDAVRDATGIRKVDAGASGLLLNGVRDDLALLPQQFPVLGDVILINGQTGTAF